LYLAQTPQQPKTSQPAPTIDDFGQIHKDALSPKTDTASEAGRFTDEIAKSLPGGANGNEVLPHKNFIDDYILGRIERDRIPHAGLSTDEEFLRRVYLDATGMLPAAEEVRKFTADKDPQKRDKVIDSLIGTEQFAEQWAWFFGALFRLNNYSGDNKDAFQYWNKEWLRVDRPYNDVLRDLLTPSSKNHASIPSLAFFGRVARNAAYKDRLATDPDNYGALSNRLDGIDEATVEIGRIFLGMNLECISCHNGAGHLDAINMYLAKRNRSDFAQQAAFLGRLTFVFEWQYTENEVIDGEGKGYDTGNDAPYFTKSESKFPRTGKAYEPVFILTGEHARPDADPRAELARMIAAHPQFSRATVNLIWSKLMTVGFVEPYDGFDLARLDPKQTLPKPWAIQPANPELLEALANDFRSNNYSMHHLMKTIMKSTSYQLASSFPAEWKESYTSYYPRKFVRVMTGPEVVDTIAQATARPYTLPFSGIEVERVKQVTDLGDLGGRRKGNADMNTMMTSFFEGNRYTPSAAGNKATIMQAILMMRSGLVNERVLAENGSRVQKLIDSGKSNDEIIEELYLSTLSRRPTEPERKAAIHAFEFEKNRKIGVENLQWALLNGIEFVLNH
jgi:hypothetical protein